jgi:adenylate cyclase
MPRGLAKAILFGVLIGVLGVVVSLIPVVPKWEEKIELDWLFSRRGIRTPPAEVVVVSVDKISADSLGLQNEPDSWPRSMHAELVDNLVSAGASVIAFDITFDEFRSPAEDEMFAAAIRRAGNVILSGRLQKETIVLKTRAGSVQGELITERLIPPIPVLEQAAMATAPFPLPVIPFTVSQFWTFKASAGDGATLPAVALQAFALPAWNSFVKALRQVRPDIAAALPQNSDEIVEDRSLQRLMPELRGIFQADSLLAPQMLERLDDSDLMLRSLINIYHGDDSHYLNYFGPPRSITTVPYYQVLQLSGQPADRVGSVDFRGKAVFVGFSAELQPEQKDAFYSVFSDRSGLDLSGVEIAATAFANLLENGSIKPLPMPAYLLVVFLWGLCVGALALLLSPRISVGTCILLAVLYLVFASFQFRSAGIWWPLLVILAQVLFAWVAAILWRYLDTQRAFGYFVPATVVDQLTHEPVPTGAHGESTRCTLLMTDAAHYSTVSESTGSDKLWRLLNDYLAVLYQQVEKHGGVVCDQEGDSIVAFWRMSPKEPGARSRACRAALGITTAIERFNAARPDLTLPTRVGLHAGEVTLGMLGGGHHFEYHAVGDAVNTVSRIQSLNKTLHTHMLISDEIHDRLQGFVTRDLGTFLLYNKVKPTAIHELIGLAEQPDASREQLTAVFTEALDQFRNQCWDDAGKQFERILNQFGNYGPAKFYLALCEQYRKEGPGRSWNGVVRVLEK